VNAMLSNHRSTLWLIARLTLLTLSLLLLIAGHLWADEDSPRDKMGFIDILLLPRVWVGALFGLMGIIALMKVRPIETFRTLALPLIFFVFGVLYVLPLGEFARGMGMHPSPVCVMTKPFAFVNAGRGIPIVFSAILFSIAIMSLLGNKSFCGWVCPIGALQEFVHLAPVPKRFKFKLPFRFTNTLRAVFFFAFIALTFAVGEDIFNYVSPFHALHWTFPVLEMIIFIVVMIVALFIFRPFCYLFCPIGLLTWLLEQVSLTRIEVDPDKCTTCYECTEKAPCPAMGPIVDGHKWRPDCHACGRCLNTCPESAISFAANRMFKK
jgi:polyferredoxin